MAKLIHPLKCELYLWISCIITVMICYLNKEILQIYLRSLFRWLWSNKKVILSWAGLGMSFQRERSQRNALMLALKQWMDKVNVYWMTKCILSAGKRSRNIANSNFIIQFSSIFPPSMLASPHTHTHTHTHRVNGISFSHKEEGNPVIYDNMDEMEVHYAKWNKPHTEGQILYMWKLRGGGEGQADRNIE